MPDRQQTDHGQLFFEQPIIEDFPDRKPTVLTKPTLICRSPACDRKATVGTLCDAHYARIRENRKKPLKKQKTEEQLLSTPLRLGSREGQICRAPECGRALHSADTAALGLCPAHYDRVQQNRLRLAQYRRTEEELLRPIGVRIRRGKKLTEQELKGLIPESRLALVQAENQKNYTGARFESERKIIIADMEFRFDTLDDYYRACRIADLIENN